MTSEGSPPFRMAPASLLLKGSQLLYSSSWILRSSSSYTLLPGTRFLVKAPLLPPSRPPPFPPPSTTRTLLVIAMGLSSLFRSRRRWLLILYLDKLFLILCSSSSLDDSPRLPT